MTSRLVRLQQAVANRCQSVQLVLDGLDNPGNINACLRTAEGLGLLVVHIVAAPAGSRIASRTDAGASKWLQLKVWPDPADCLAALRRDDCRLIGLSPAPDSRPIEEVDFTDGRTAVILGNEQRGLSPQLAAAAELVRLPLVGLVQSYNVSVAAALALQTAFRQRWPEHADLDRPQQRQLLADYRRRQDRRLQQGL